jgi:hypothetical protein
VFDKKSASLAVGYLFRLPEIPKLMPILPPCSVCVTIVHQNPICRHKVNLPSRKLSNSGIRFFLKNEGFEIKQNTILLFL